MMVEQGHQPVQGHAPPAQAALLFMLPCVLLPQTSALHALYDHPITTSALCEYYITTSPAYSAVKGYHYKYKEYYEFKVPTPTRMRAAVLQQLSADDKDFDNPLTFLNVDKVDVLQLSHKIVKSLMMDKPKILIMPRAVARSICSLLLLPAELQDVMMGTSALLCFHRDEGTYFQTCRRCCTHCSCCCCSCCCCCPSCCSRVICSSSELG